MMLSTNPSLQEIKAEIQLVEDTAAARIKAARATRKRKIRYLKAFYKVIDSEINDQFTDAGLEKPGAPGEEAA